MVLSSGTEKSEAIHEVLGNLQKQQNPIQSKEYCTNLEILFGPAISSPFAKGNNVTEV